MQVIELRLAQFFRLIISLNHLSHREAKDLFIFACKKYAYILTCLQACMVPESGHVVKLDPGVGQGWGIAQTRLNPKGEWVAPPHDVELAVISKKSTN